MYTPMDKIRNKKNDIIQIMLTHKCSLYKCSNCTQLLPFRKDVAEMSLECVEKALIGMQGWPGIIAAFGGNPCSHSKFSEICELFQKYVPVHQRGFWTNDLLSHGKIASETFVAGKSRFNFNVHGNAKAIARFKEWYPSVPIYGVSGRSQHGQVLGYYKDYGIADEDWVGLRENCDINKNWSGAIRECEGEPFVYFCEVAASIDGVRNVNNGIPLQLGWWDFPIDTFKHQISNCCDNGCVVPLRLKGHRDGEDFYDISKTWETQLDNSRNLVQLQVNTDLSDKAKELTDYERLRS